MYKKATLILAAVGLLLSTSLAWTPAVAVGPPFLSLEIPANPLDPQTRGAALVVRAYHHERAAGYPITGSAEGLVNGERRSIPLEFERTSSPSVYTLDQQWPAEGDWLLVIQVEANADAGLIVELGADGGISDAEYFGMPTKTVSARSVRAVSGKIGSGKIDQTLRIMASTTED